MHIFNIFEKCQNIYEKVREKTKLRVFPKFVHILLLIILQAKTILTQNTVTIIQT